MEKRVSLPLVKLDEGGVEDSLDCLSCSLYSSWGVGLCSLCKLFSWENLEVALSFSLCCSFRFSLRKFPGSVGFSLKILFVFLHPFSSNPLHRVLISSLKSCSMGYNLIMLLESFTVQRTLIILL